jgi:DNA uptake protein ComE-like DNA-binding protein
MKTLAAVLTFAALVVTAAVPAAGQTPPAGSAGALVNPNTATEADLARVPNIGAANAKAIVARRPFASMTALDQFLVAQKLTREQITAAYGRMFIPLDLNTASDAELLLIPNLGKRMLGEFKEYRPYKAIEQFRREIGKYVSKDEVARLERYVVIG